MEDLGRFLGRHPPFDTVDDSDLHKIAAAAVVADYTPGERILDAFVVAVEELFVVLTGQVQLWNSLPGGDDDPDEILGSGGVFGFSALLSKEPIGPLAVALGPVRMARIPAAVVAPIFSSAAGFRFLARNLATSVARPAAMSNYGIVDQLIVSTPVVVPPEATISAVAALMTERHSRYAVVGLDDGYGIVTDALLRSRVLAPGMSADEPIARAMDAPAPWVVSGTLAAQALLELTERNLDCLLVTDRRGDLRGIVARDDFIVSPSTAGVSLREQIGRTTTADQLVVLSRRLPLVVADLVRRGRSAAEVTTVYSTVVDAIVRRALTFVLSESDDLESGELTWLSLGSNGRREPVLSSDIDAAVVFAESVDSPERASLYRNAFADIATLLDRCGLAIDLHGAVPGRPLFARTESQWRTAAHQWIREPLENNGMMMTSLLLDARSIQGDPGLPTVNELFGDIHRHPGTLRLLLAESLSHRARLRSMRDVLARRGGTFDIKTHALRPIVDIARWAALSVGSAELATGARLAAAAGSEMVPQDQAEILSEVFEVLQKVRLRHQLAQIDRGEKPSDVISMRRLSPLDRSLIAQGVKEVSTVQRRMTQFSRLTSPDSW